MALRPKPISSSDRFGLCTAKCAMAFRSVPFFLVWFLFSLRSRSCTLWALPSLFMHIYINIDIDTMCYALRVLCLSLSPHAVRSPLQTHILYLRPAGTTVCSNRFKCFFYFRKEFAEPERQSQCTRA